MFLRRRVNLLLLIALIGLFVVTGCTGNEVKDGEAELRVNVPVGQINAQSLDLTLESVKVTIINRDNANDSQSEEVTVKEGDQSLAFNFESLNNGSTYDVLVSAKDIEGYEVYEGAALANIDGDSKVSVSMELLESKSIVFLLSNLPEEASSGTVTILPEELNLEAPVDIDTGRAEFTSVSASEYSGLIKLYDSNSEEILNKKTQSFKALPGREVEVRVNLDSSGEDGRLIVDVTFPSSPEDPTELVAQFNEATGSIDLSWSDSADEYLIYRGTSEDEKVILSEDAIANNSYSDYTVSGSTTYYYWIRSYSSDDRLFGNLVGPANATTPTPDGVVLYFETDSHTPHIYTWYEDSDEVEYNPTGDWDNQQAMEADGDDWYKVILSSEDDLANYEQGTPLGIIITDGNGNSISGGDDFINELGEYRFTGDSWVME